MLKNFFSNFYDNFNFRQTKTKKNHLILDINGKKRIYNF